jgi:predicted ATPase
VPPQATYRFKHALIQDAAYQSLLKSTRQQYHQRIAQVLEARFPELCETQPELLAHHYTEAGVLAQAIPYWQRAGQRALARSAYVEAIGHLTTGLEVLKNLPDTPERTRQELTLQITLAPSLMAAKGLAAPEVERAYTRALVLCRQVGETPQLFPVLVGLWRFHAVRAEYQTAHELEERLLRLAQSVQDPALLLEAHRPPGQTLFCLGELVQARAHLEQAIALYNPEQHHSHALLYGNDAGVMCLSWLSWTLWVLGYPDQALERSHEALTLAQALAHPPSLATGLHFASMLHQLRREGQAIQERAEAAIILSTEQGMPLSLAMGMIPRGWALVKQGRGAEGLAQIRQGLAAYRVTGMAMLQPHILALLAEAYGDMEQAEEGLTVLDEALAVVERTGERYWEVELHRLKGTLLLARSAEHQAEVEACFRQALDIARRRQAKSLELRAAMSLSRLWQQQGKRVAARELLAPIYGWFTEGFDTADLQEAKALLKELGG